MSVVVPPVPPVRLLAITGAPGAGKSTLAAHLLRTGQVTAVVAMDGFHHADAELRRLGLLDVKGAPDTFDAQGYAALLARVAHGEPDVLAPSFDHRLGEPRPGTTPVPTTGTVVTEGNYLLLDEPRWRAARAPVDVVWHVRLADDVRRRRLVARHETAGRSPQDARAWVARVDEANAVLVESAADRADLVLDLTGWTAGGVDEG